MPRLYILAGCNGAGKTTASYTFLPEILDCREFVNSDEFAKSLSPFDPSIASVAASRYMIRRIQYLLDLGADFSIETTLATRSLVSTIKDRSTYLESKHLRCKSKMKLQHLSDIHSGRTAEWVKNDIKWTTIWKEWHILFWEYS